jgi:hypothetical protein
MQIGSYGANAPAQSAFDSLFNPTSGTASSGGSDLFATLMQAVRGAGSSAATTSSVPVSAAGVDADGHHDGSTATSGFEAGLSRIRSLFHGAAASSASAAVSTSTAPAKATDPITTTTTASADVLIRQRQLEQLLLNAYTSNFKIHQFDSGISMTGSAAAGAAIAA